MNIAVIMGARQVIASTVLGIFIAPPSTAGGGATSTRSGPGTFHLYAVDDDNHVGDVYSLGISGYTIAIGTAVTASDNRSPMTTILDSNGSPQPAGFTELRSVSNAPTMIGSQPLPGHSPFLILGFGQTASNFTTVAASQPGAVVAGPTISGSWGGPYNSSLADFPGMDGSKKWLFIGEGTYNPSSLNTPQSIATSAVFTHYLTYVDGPSISTSIIFIPEPATEWLICLALFCVFGMIRHRELLSN